MSNMLDIQRVQKWCIKGKLNKMIEAISYTLDPDISYMASLGIVSHSQQGKINKEKAIAALLEVLKTEDTTYVQKNVSICLGNIGGEAVIPFMVERLNSNDGLYQHNSILALGLINHASTVQPLIDYLKKELAAHREGKSIFPDNLKYACQGLINKGNETAENAIYDYLLYCTDDYSANRKNVREILQLFAHNPTSLNRQIIARLFAYIDQAPHTKYTSRLKDHLDEAGIERIGDAAD